MKTRIFIACVSTYPPRQCGIAAFSRDLVAAYNNLYFPEVEMRIVPIQAPGSRLRYKNNILGIIHQDNSQSYIDVARKLNSNKQTKLVIVQHEFGIFGGQWGQYLELFLNELKKPSVIVFHTILPNPDPVVLERVTKLASLASGIIVMTHSSKQILLSDYHIAEHKITVIAHGIHPVRYISPSEAKKKLLLPQAPILSTFGFLSPNKGIEYVISALPAIVKKFPTSQYYIIGKTHPMVNKSEGESYRKTLQLLVKNLGLNNHVHFINRFLKTSELLEYLQATDIYIAGPLNPNQAVSGTLSYALGTGRAVVSTQFAQAKEDITSDVGVLVPFRDSQAFAKTLLDLLSSKEQLGHMGKNAYFKTRHMTWPNVALAYAKYFSRFSAELSKKNKSLPPIKLDQVEALTDDFGIFQFAQMHVPDPKHGYTLDDNARALVVMVKYYKKYKKQKALVFISTYLGFIQAAATGDGKFHNYFNADRTINACVEKNENLEDANARCLYALMTAAGSRGLPEYLRNQAKKLYEPFTLDEFKSPRAAAFYIQGLLALPKSAKTRAKIIKLCDFLVYRYKQSRMKEWYWFERQFTYSNALLSEALLFGFIATGKKQYYRIGKKTLDFLISQTFVDGMYMAIGQDGWFNQGGVKASFDQQPEDPAAMVRALKTMHRICGQKKYNELMHIAFRWFLGDNVLGQFVYDTVTGGSYDGISQKKTNLNQGAESTLSYLLARLAL